MFTFTLLRDDYATSAEDEGDLGETSHEREDIITTLDRLEHNLLAKLDSLEEIHKQWLQVEKERLNVDKRRLEVEKERLELSKEKERHWSSKDNKN